MWFGLHSIELFAQETTVKNQRNPFISIESGYSFASVKFLGKTLDTQSFFLQLNYLRKMKASQASKPVYYKVSVIPVLDYHYPKRDEGERRDNVHGFGISPVGLYYWKEINPVLSYSLSTAGGIILINKKFPTDEGRRLNFTFEISSSITYNKFEKAYFSIGYKFHHISNAQTGKENPGIDSNFLTFTITVLK